MRALAAVVVVALAGCPRNDTCSTTGGSCSGGLVCTRDGECLDAADVRMVKVTWTIGGMTASATTCAPMPQFKLDFVDVTIDGDSFGYEPVPCIEGQFTIDRIPTRFGYVSIETTLAMIDDVSNTATIDLP